MAESTIDDGASRPRAAACQSTSARHGAPPEPCRAIEVRPAAAVREAMAGKTVIVTDDQGEPRMFILGQAEPLDD